MTTIYTNIDSNKRLTMLWLTVFLVFVIGFGWVLGYFLNKPWIIVLAVLVAFFQALVSYYYSDKIALSSAGAKQVSRNQAPELHRLVENLAITAGIPKPKIYVIDDQSPNAFATGRDPKNASVAVTTGLLEIMDKNELQGVLAHELSHVGNYDIRLMSIVVVLVGIVVLASDFFLRWNFWSNSNDDDNNQGRLIFLVVGIIFAIVAPIFATLIQLAISRKREFLADSDAVLLTRYPQGMISALKKLEQYNRPMRKASSATAHLFISNPFGKEKQISWWKKIFSTHPPIVERIKALEN